MQENELKNILEELYKIDSSLREFEGPLREVIIQMSDLGPDTQFTPALAARIKEQVMNKVKEVSIPNHTAFSFNFINKQKYVYVGSALVIVLLLMLVVYKLPAFKQFNPDSNLELDLAGKDNNLALNTVRSDNGDEVIKLAANAFGSLSAQTSGQDTGMALAQDARMVNELGQASVMPVSSETVSVSVSNDFAITPIAPGFGAGGSGGMSMSKMIAPWYQIKYVYAGEQLTLKDERGEVYKRLVGTMNSNLISLVKNLKFSDLEMSSFNNLTVSNLSLMEDKEKGLAINFDFVNDNIYISENWQKWRIPERDACGADNACWERFRLKESDVPSDSDLIAISDEFISNHEISLNHYGPAQVDNNWRQDYELSSDKNNYYIPEYMSVVYPLMINEEAVLDQSGNPYGLRVNINLLQNMASGLNGLSPYRYQSSDYNLETDFSRIVKVAETSNRAGIYYGSLNDREVQEIKLGTPTRAYVQYWRYQNNNNEELLIPALVFPVLTNNNQAFYGQRSVVVPLVKELW
ncbi:hypothetical protein K9M09_00240 [Patescibacteria group bacterium]|nr:hypothetical protein [Patescibacteria group bacterium]